MTRDQLELSLRRAGLLDTDITAALREAAEALEDEADDTSEADAAEQAGLTKHGIDIDVWNALPPSERMTRERLHNPQPPVSRRPVYRPLTAAELAELDATGLTGSARTEWARVRQQTPAPQ